MIVANISLNLARVPFKETEEVRKTQFWSSDLLPQSIKKEVKFHTFQHYIFWFLALLTVISFYVECMREESIYYKIIFSVCSICGYYYVNAIEVYFTYGTTNCYFQAKIICEYIKRESEECKDIADAEIFEKRIKVMLVKSFQQYRTIRRFLLLSRINLFYIIYFSKFLGTQINLHQCAIL